MTATPIPRTLSLTAYGDLDSSVLRELPAGRRPVKTWVVGEEKRAGAYEFIREQLREGRQAFVVCPLVTESEKLQAKAAAAEGERLARGEFADFRRRHPPRPDAVGGEAAAMERFVVGDRERARRDERDRGRDRRRQRGRDADRGGRPLRPLAAAPAARTGRTGRAREPLHPLRRSRVRAGARCGWTRSEASATASSSPRWTWRCAARARSSAPVSTACRASGSPTCPRTAALLAAARQEVIELLGGTDRWTRRSSGPLMDAARARFGDERAERDRGVRVVAGELGGRRLHAGEGRRRAPDRRPRPRGALLDPRRRRRRARPRSLLREPARSAIEALSRGAAEATPRRHRTRPCPAQRRRPRPGRSMPRSCAPTPAHFCAVSEGLRPRLLRPPV